MAIDERMARTFLFVPGNRPDRFDKAVASGADVVIIDLEDAVAHADKDFARQAAAEWLQSGGSAAVRINPPGTPWFADDLRAVGDARAAVVPKAESPQELAEVVAALQGRPVIAIIESAAGLAQVSAIAAVVGVTRLAFGNVDLAADLGVDPASRAALAVARSQVVYASAAQGCDPPIDGVTTAVLDAERLADDVRHARELGFTGKLLIHPDQVQEVAESFSPTQSDMAWATEVLRSAEGGVSVVGGHMVDEPVLRRARNLLARAREFGLPATVE